MNETKQFMPLFDSNVEVISIDDKNRKRQEILVVMDIFGSREKYQIMILTLNVVWFLL